MRSMKSEGVGIAALAAAALIAAAVAGPAIAAEPIAPLSPLEPLAGAPTDTLAQRIIQLFALVTALSFAPGLAMIMTSLPMIIIVLSILRQGLGLQQSPPSMLLMGLALFLTYFVMEPVFQAAWAGGVEPFMDGAMEAKTASVKVLEPFRGFMEARVDADAIALLAEARGASTGEGPPPFSLLAPAFVLSEIQRAFEIGFVILLPFLIIDLIIASVLMAMGMMMVPPAIVSLPFKLAFCVLTNGWVAISAALVRSYQ